MVFIDRNVLIETSNNNGSTRRRIKREGTQVNESFRKKFGYASDFLDGCI